MIVGLKGLIQSFDEKRNSASVISLFPAESKDRRRSTSEPVVPPQVITKFPPIQNGPYPNFIRQGDWTQKPEAETVHRDAAPGKNLSR